MSARPTPLVPDDVLVRPVLWRRVWRCLDCPGQPVNERAAKAHAGRRGHIVARDDVHTSYVGTSPALDGALEAASRAVSGR